MPDSTATTDNKVSVDLDIDPQAVAELVGAKVPADASDEHKDAASSSKVTHDISLTVSNMTFASFKESIGSTDILSSAELSLTPTDASDPLHAELHADLLKQQLNLGAFKSTTDISGGVKVTDGEGVGGDFKVEEDAEFSGITLYGTVSSDFGGGSTGKVTGELGMKFNF